ncbi:hypothetical protein [Bifidobacterium simiarum]|uniref:Uncharacterized protein n=1 Tax=Bifidobacterium simiarum TaxID=2045441 RepID=A0A2M9HDS2_9BIFI|nr:hypothetical protein [Bifidobacterium simiarum]PJM74956.1 hypothetical protein CSQ87_06900 [Bifidobacterium simiarum]
MTGKTSGGASATSPWSDGVRRTYTPRDVIAGLTGGFDPDLAFRVLDDPQTLAFANRYLTRYLALAGHLPYPYESRVERECRESTPEGDADLAVALAVGYGVPDAMFDELQGDIDWWDGGLTMGPVDAGPSYADLFAPVLLGDGGAEGDERGGTEEHWDVTFVSRRCRVLVRRDDAGALTLRVDMPEGDGRHTLTLRFADGSEMTLSVDVRRGTWRRGGVPADGVGLPISATVK